MTANQTRADQVQPGMTIKLVKPHGDSPLDDWTVIGSAVPDDDGRFVGFFAPDGGVIHEAGYVHQGDGSLKYLPYPWRSETKFLVRVGT